LRWSPRPPHPLPTMKFRKGHRLPASRLRAAVETMPRHSREAMLRGLDSGPIIAGAYADSRTGGICPMLAAHRNGGRTDLSSFARSWDFFTGARRPRLATRRELQTLRSYLEMSLIDSQYGTHEPMTVVADRLRAERARWRAEAHAEAEIPARQPSRERGPLADTRETDRSAELRDRRGWAWIRPTKSYDEYRRRIAAASEQFGEQRAAELLGSQDQVANCDGSPGRV
jgi:hypothetical protein